MRRTVFAGLGFALVLVLPGRVSAASINFSDLSEPGTGYVNFAATVRDGFSFSSDLTGPYGGLGLTVWRNDDPNHPVGGATTTSLFEYTALNTTTIARVGGGAFGLTAIDLAPWGQFLSSFPATFPVTFKGTKSDHTTVQQTFMVENRPGAPQLQTFTFTGFTDLTSVSVQQGVYFSGTAFQFDNVVLTGGPSSGVLCETAVNQNSYSNGDSVQLSTLRLANLGSNAAATEIKVWLGLPDGTNLTFVNTGANGSVVLPPGFDVHLGPATLFQVTAALARGGYEISCRLLEPVTGKVIASNFRSFVIQ
jgi:hypothetical protein